jgi:hypothetical protein
LPPPTLIGDVWILRLFGAKGICKALASRLYFKASIQVVRDLSLLNIVLEAFTFGGGSQAKSA